jgi:hypothetical protein
MPMERARLHKHDCTRRPLVESQPTRGAPARYYIYAPMKDLHGLLARDSLARRAGGCWPEPRSNDDCTTKRASSHCGCGTAAPSPVKMLSAAATIFHTPSRCAQPDDAFPLSMARSDAQSERAAEPRAATAGCRPDGRLWERTPTAAQPGAAERRERCNTPALLDSRAVVTASPPTASKKAGCSRDLVQE